MNANQKGFTNIALIILAVVLAGGALGYLTLVKKPASTELPTTPQISLPTSCKSEPGNQPVITSLSRNSGPIEIALEIKGCNLAGFEGDLNVYFERSDGKKIILTDLESFLKTRDSLIKVVVKEPCQQGETIYGRYSGIPTQCNYVAMIPGLYKVYTEPWGKRSNTAFFTITE